MVSVVAHAESLRFMGCRLKKATDLTATNLVAGAVMMWDTEVFDTDAFHDTGANTHRITPPSGKGINYIRLHAHFRGENHTSGQFADIFIRNSAAVAIATQRVELTATSIRVAIDTGPIAHVDGEWYEALFSTESDASTDVIAAQSYFACEVVG
jgi:hypothetical protein